MIGIVGHMSGGKTYTAVEYMLQALLGSHVVVSNVRLKCRGVTSYLQVPCVVWMRYYYLLSDTPGYHHLLMDDYEHYPEGVPRGSPDYEQKKVYIFYDEVSSVFDSLTHGSDKSVQAVATWARHTHKRGQEIYLIMQFSNELHKRLRVHVVEYITCTNSNNLRLPLVNFGLPWFLRGFIIRTRYLGDETTLVEHAKWSKLNPAIYDCYDTSQIVVGHTLCLSSPPPAIDYSFRRFNSTLDSFIRFFLLQFVLFFLGGIYVYIRFRRLLAK